MERYLPRSRLFKSKQSYSIRLKIIAPKNLSCIIFLTEKLLLKYNPDLNAKDKDGMTPCMWACHLDHLEHFKLISKHENKKKGSSNPTEIETDNDGRTWVHWSVRKNEPLKCLNVNF